MDVSQNIYPAELAARFKDCAGQKYRPANGREGIVFAAVFCQMCKRDAAFRAGAGDSCDINYRSLCYAKDRPEYPTEWQYTKDGQPTCTAFDPE